MTKVSKIWTLVFAGLLLACGGNNCPKTECKAETDAGLVLNVTCAVAGDCRDWTPGTNPSCARVCKNGDDFGNDECVRNCVPSCGSGHCTIGEVCVAGDGGRSECVPWFEMPCKDGSACPHVCIAPGCDPNAGQAHATVCDKGTCALRADVCK